MSFSNLGTLPPGAIILGNITAGQTGPPAPSGVYGITSLLDGWTCKQGDSALTFSDTLTYSDGSIVDLTGATVALAMRDLSSATPVTLTGSGSVTSPTGGDVAYKPNSDDTAVAGDFTCNWIVEFSDLTVMTFPSIGYIPVIVEPAMESEPQLLVDLETVKRYPGMSIGKTDRHTDSRLIDFIRAVQPMVEQVTGPILPQIFEEWHDGGQNYITLRRPPSTGYGTSPLLNLIACSEYAGPIEWPLAIVASPDQGQMYSCQLDTRLGRVVRRTAGGGVQPFPYMPQAVHVVYQAGQAVVPYNVREGTLELIRLNWQTTQPVGTGRRTVADAQDTGAPLGFFMPKRIREMLSPNRRHPSIA